MISWLDSLSNHTLVGMLICGAYVAMTSLPLWVMNAAVSV